QGFLEVISKGLSTSEKNLLRAVPQDGATVYELTKALGVSEKTTRNLVSRLKAKGLLTKVGKGERIFLTKAGWALA
ncbi:MAG: MarR family transcriptional regulator, partial [Sulfolobales archaeon]